MARPKGSSKKGKGADGAPPQEAAPEPDPVIPAPPPPGQRRTIEGKDLRVVARRLSVELTKEELGVLGQDLAASGERLEELETEKRQTAGDYNKRIKEKRDECRLIRLAVRTKRQERIRECAEVPDYQRKVVALRVIEPGEGEEGPALGRIVETRSMTDGELQAVLAFPEKVAKANLAEIARRSEGDGGTGGETAH